MSKSIIQTFDAPEAIGTYSQGIRSKDWVFTSGQIPINPKTGELITDDFRAEVHQVLKNLKLTKVELDKCFFYTWDCL